MGTEAGTYVAYRLKRFDFISGTNDDITFGEQFARRLAAAYLKDKRSGHVIAAASLHCQPLGQGLIKSPKAARIRQTRQLEAYAQWAKDCREPGCIVLVGGDSNQWLPTKWPSPIEFASILKIFADANLTPAHEARKVSGPLRLMELWASRDKRIRLTERAAIDTTVKGMDHEVVLVTARVRRRRKHRKG